MRSMLVLTAAVLHTTARSRPSTVGAFTTFATMKRPAGPPQVGSWHSNKKRAKTQLSNQASSADDDGPPLYPAEGLLAVHKPLTWTSSDVVAYIRGVLTRDAKERGADKKRKRKGPLMKVGHGGTLDPLASGVLVLGVGKGTTQLQSYLEGGKEYVAAAELGYETDTLDAEGKLVKSAPWDHVSAISDVESILPKFIGNITQVPPLFSAIRVDGKKLYQIARKDDEKAADVEIPSREVKIYELSAATSFREGVLRSGVVDGPRYRVVAKELEEAAAAAAAAAVAEAEAKAKEQEEAAKAGGDADGDAKGGESSDGEGSKSGKRGRRKKGRKRKNDGGKKKNLFDENTVPTIPLADGDAVVDVSLPRFSLALKCGGGTYVRSLVRDVGYELNTVATMTGLVRTRQGQFVLDDALRKEDWTPEKIYDAIRKGNAGK